MSDVFQTHTLSNGEYLWSNPNNWTEGVPANGENATISLSNGQTADDDIPSLTLTSLSLTSHGYIYVTGSSLSVGTIVNNSGNGLQLEVYSASMPVTITVGSITGGGGDYIANGQDASFVDNAPTDPGAFYGAYDGGTVLLHAAPASTSVLGYDGLGTISLENPGTKVAAVLEDIRPGDVLELPGTTVSSLSFGAASLTIATNAGTTTFSNFSTLYPVTGYTTGIDPDTGLEAITFIGPDIFENNVSASSGSLEGDYLWSNPGNWSDGVVPVNGDSVTFVGNSTHSSADDISTLSLSSLTLTGTGALDVSGNLGIGNLVDAGGGGAEIRAIEVNGAPPVTVTAGSITGAGGYYAALGTHASFLDNSPTDPGASYFAQDGGTVLLNAAPAAGSYMVYGGLAGGTIELEHAGSLTAAPLEQLAPGDVLELPGSAVTNVNFGAHKLTITTNTATYTFSNVSGSTIVSAYTASFDSVTGLEAVTFAGPEIFKDNVAASSGSLAGDYLWSNPANWSDGVPLNGDSVTLVGTSGDTSVDDLAALSLSSLTLTGSGGLQVSEGSLGIGTVVNDGGSGISGYVRPGALTPVTITVGSITGAGGLYSADGENVSFVDNSPTDPGADYQAYYGATVLLSATPAAGSSFEYFSTGTIELEHPGAVTDFQYQIGMGDVLELPGTTVSSASFSASSLTITTNTGTYRFTVSGDGSVLATGYTAEMDSRTGLEAITFIEPDTFEDNVSASSGSFTGDYLWSNPENWSDGVVPVNGDSVTFVGTSGDKSVDDLAALFLNTLTLTGSSGLQVSEGSLAGGSLGIGTVVNDAGYGISGYVAAGSATPVTITVGSITGAGGLYSADGENVSFVDNSPTDPGAGYQAYYGATVLLNAAPAAGSSFEYFGTGTIELEHPGAVTDFQYQIGPGDVLELPGTTVSSASFAAESLTIATNAGTYAITLSGDGSDLATGYTAEFDPSTGLEAITFTRTDTFEDNVSVSSGSLAGDYLWSNESNWTSGVPVNDDAVTFVGTANDTSVDDIAALSLSSLTLTGTGALEVSGGSLGIGNLAHGVNVGYEIQAIEVNGAPPVTVTAGSITGAGGIYLAFGTHASFLDNSPTDPGGYYFAYAGGTVLLNAAPAAGSYLEYNFFAGTIELEHPGSLTAAPLQRLAPGDVLELPGSAVTNVNFGAGNLTISTNAGTYTFSNVSESTIVSAYTASYDSVTGLEAVTFAAPEIFKDNVAASSGSLAGDYLWSNAANWTDGVPVNGDSVTFVGTSGDTSVDDLAELSLSSLTLTGEGDLYVFPGGSLTIGTAVNEAGNDSGIIADDGGPDAAMPVTVTVGSITGAGGIYESGGGNASFVDNSPTDPGATYFPFVGGTLVLNAAPVASSYLEYLGAGTLELEHPASLTAAFLQGIEPGDVLELPGTTVSSGSFDLGPSAPGGGSFTITTNAGTYTFSNVTDRSLVSDFTANFDSVTGLEAVTFAAPEIFKDNVAASSGSLAGDYLWSNAANWTDGVPVNGDSVTFVGTSGDTSVDDLAELSLSSLTLTGEGDLYVFPGGSLTIGTAVNEAGNDSGIIADDGGPDAAMPVTVTVGSITGAGGIYESGGGNARFVDNSPTDPGATYFPFVGGTLVLNAAPVASSYLEYLAAGTLELEHPASLTAAFLQGIEPGDVLELPGTTVSSGIFDLSPVAPGGGSFTITTNAGTYTFSNVTERSLVSGYTANFDTGTGLEAITFTETACYVGGTRIATAAGEVKVEDLEIGDFVATLHAGMQKIKWIGRRSYDGRFIAGNKDVLPICIKRHAIAENIPARDLFVSPGHAICIDGALIHAIRLVNGVSVIQAECVESVTYYHIELETHEVIFAENCPAETFLGEDFRQQFQNAWQFAHLYPSDSATETMCLPRLDSGFQLHAIQQRIAARAGIPASAAREPGPLRGYVDQAGPKTCCGWVQDISAPEDPVCLDITEDGRTIGRVLANLYRADLRAAGYGSGYHGFEFMLPPGITGRIDAVRAADRAVLAWTESAAAQAA